MIFSGEDIKAVSNMKNAIVCSDMQKEEIEQFRNYGYKIIDMICDYYENLESLPEPGYLRPLIPESCPNEPESYEQIIDDVKSKIMPGMTHWQHPCFFGYYPANTSFPSILGEMLSAMWNSIGFNWICSPAMTELETIVLDWLGSLLGLPEVFLSRGRGGGSIQGSASEAQLVVMIAARDLALKRFGPGAAEKLVAYASDQAHSAAQKAAMILNIKFKTIPTSEADCYAMQGPALEKQLQADVAAGLIPFFICVTIGTTSSCAVDNIANLVPICQQNQIWLHIDAAYAGAALVCPEYQYLIKDVGCADSFNMNCSKMMLTNFDCSCLWVQERSHIINALSLTPEYLRTKEYESGFVTDYRDWQVPLGRRFRALKLWFVLRRFGAEKLRQHIRKNVEFCELFKQKVQEDKRFEVAVTPFLALVCFRLCIGDETTNNGINEKLLEAIQKNSGIFLTHTMLGSKYVLRFVSGSPWTETKHIEFAWSEVQNQADLILSSISIQE